MRRHEESVADGQTLVYYTYTLFEPYSEVQCIVSTRTGGVSSAPYASLNLSYYVGDAREHVSTNRERFHNIVNARKEQVARAQNRHSANVAVVTADTPCGGYHYIPDTDALITDIVDKPLMMSMADCASVAFFDPVHRTIAMVHAGWRGVASSILPKTILRMTEEFQTNPSDVLIGISPCMGPCCFEVQNDLIQVFAQSFPEVYQSFFVQQENGTMHLDMWQAIRWQLEQSGVVQRHIESADICTACHTEEFYSHRAEHGKTGRFGSIIALR